VALLQQPSLGRPSEITNAAGEIPGPLGPPIKLES
jgi:hypothetical protein